MLDVISGAMAAFLILVVVLLPYYKKEHIDYQAINNELRQALAEAETRVQAAEVRAEAARTAAEQASEEAAERVRVAEADARSERDRADGLARKLAKTFIVLYIRWDTSDDVDLHVVDPSEGHFYHGDKTVDGHPGELSEDTLVGPGSEVWEVREAPSGAYKVSVQLWSRSRNPECEEVNDLSKPVTVKGRIFHRDGSSAFPEVQLRTEKQWESLAVIGVDDQGDVTVR